MESHPSYPALSALLARYPKSSSSLFQTYNDITYGQQWTDIELIDLECCSRGAIRGKKRDNDDLYHVIPCSLSETLSFEWLQGAFKTLFSKERMDNVAAPPFLYVAITSSDSSIVYYKLSQGIVKPPV